VTRKVKLGVFTLQNDGAKGLQVILAIGSRDSDPGGAAPIGNELSGGIGDFVGTRKGEVAILGIVRAKERGRRRGFPPGRHGS